MTPQLEFKGAGEGTREAGSDAAASTDTITIEGDQVQAVSPEGERRSMKLLELLERVAPPRIDTCGTVLPDGVKCVIPIPKGAIFVHQTAPRVHSFEWIAKDSPKPYGKGTRYRQVSIALPYLIVMAVFDEGRGGVPRLAGSSECFFSNQPLDVDGVDTQLLFPALLNCSRFHDGDLSKPLSWICVQHLPEAAHVGEKTAGRAIRKGLGALLQHLLEAKFNLSSEHHEISSWYSESVKAEIDPRIASVEAWERASTADRLFALEVPWLPTGKTLQEVAQRIANARGAGRPRFQTARDLLRAIFQPAPRSRRTR